MFSGSEFDGAPQHAPTEDQLMPGDAFVARSFPSDTSLEIPYRPVPEQNHAE
jgi:hypothetical protein